MERTDRLPIRLRLLAVLMRAMPKGIRKFSWLWERLYRYIGGGGFEDNEAIDSLWPSGECGPIRNGRFGYIAFLDLRVFAERRTYFSGAYIQRDLEYLFPLLIKQGDQYLDIGANIGMTAMMASVLIGRRGKGLAFEPNPEVFARLKRHFELNHISNIEPVPVALSNQEAEMNLFVPNRFSGYGSLSAAPGVSGRSFTIRTLRGGSYVDSLDPAKATIIKIDVEGFEVKALSGIEDFLGRPEVAIVSEVSVGLLRRAGDSPEGLFELLTKHGFRPFTFELRSGRFQTDLAITAVESFTDAIPEDWRDFLFAKPTSKIFRERIAPLLTASR
jgi:FkbM family methyltransferase